MSASGSNPQTVIHDEPTVLDPSELVELTDGVWVLPDRDRTPHIPNVGIIAGTHSALIIESGIGIANGERVLAAAREVAGTRRLYLTVSHFHPEHGYGVQALADAATIVYNEAQRDELAEKFQSFVEMFSGFGLPIAHALTGVRYVEPDIVFSDVAKLQLGDRTAELHHYGLAHTRGDQIVWLPAERVLFTGDLVEERFFAIMGDDDVSPNRWIARLEQMEALEPLWVVPGHGAVGDGSLIAGAKAELEDVRDRVLELHAAGQPLEAMSGKITEEALARHPDWGNTEWVPRIVECVYAESVVTADS